MPTVNIPSLLRDMTQGHASVVVQGTTIGQIVESLEQAYPGIRGRLCNNNGVRPGIAVVVDNDVSRLGLRQPVQETSEIHFLPAVSGG